MVSIRQTLKSVKDIPHLLKVQQSSLSCSGECIFNTFMPMLSLLYVKSTICLSLWHSLYTLLTMHSLYFLIIFYYHPLCSLFVFF